jgi:hypothetical protein
MKNNFQNIILAPALLAAAQTQLFAKARVHTYQGRLK